MSKFKLPTNLKWLHKKTILIAAGVVGVLALAFGAGTLLRWYQMGEQKTDQESTAPQTEAKIPQSILNAEQLARTGKPDEARQKIDEALKNESLPPEEKAQLYNAKANLEMEKKDYKAALVALLKANEAVEDFDTVRSIGATYQQLGDNAKAIEYYKKAIAINPDSNPMKERQTEMLQEMIRSLGGQP